jgi:hypothetical protein
VIGKLILFTANPAASVVLISDSGPSVSGTSVNGTVELDFDFPDGIGNTLIIDNVTYRGVLWISKLNPVNGSASFAVDTFPFRHSFPAVPTREEVLGIGMHFRGGIVIDSVEFGKMPWWPPALCWCNSDTRQLVYQAMRAAGDTHVIIDIPDGVPLYNEAGQFYDPIRFGALDWTNGLTTFDSRLSDLVDEVIGEGFKFYMTLDDRMDVSYKLVQMVTETLTDEQLKYGVIVPGFDGVFYGWPLPSDITNWATLAREAKPQAYLGIQFNLAHIPVGGGPADYESGGPMDGFDLISGSFPSLPWTVPGNSWQIMSRCVHPYIRPADEPADADGISPPFFLVDSPRGVRFFCAFETSYPYNWVRVDMNNQIAINNAILEMDKERIYFKSMGCHFVG